MNPKQASNTKSAKQFRLIPSAAQRAQNRNISTHIILLLAVINVCSSGSLVFGQAPQDIVTAGTGAPTRRTDADILKELDCSDCIVASRKPMSLPETGIEAEAVKVVDRYGQPRASLAIDKDGRRLSPEELIKNEAGLREQRYEKMTSELYDSLSGRDPDELVNIAIWTKLAVQLPARERFRAEPDLSGKTTAAIRSAIAEKKGPVIEEVIERRGSYRNNDGASPLIHATVPVAEVAKIAAHPNVASVDLEPSPVEDSCPKAGPYTGAECTYVWYRSISAGSFLGNGAGQKVCVNENAQPASTTYLCPGMTVHDPSGGTGTHSQAVAGTLCNLDSPSYGLTPSAQIFVGNQAQFSTGWCAANGVQTITQSLGWGVDPGPTRAIDWEHDWLAKVPPYLLFVASSGNAPNATTSNRLYNGLVVGGDNTHGTVSPVGDAVSQNYSWVNPQTSYGDMELPNVVAPDDGDYVGHAWINATSAATPMVAGTSMLVSARDPGAFDIWPELKRAVVMATAVWRMDQPRITHLGGSVPDQQPGAGLIDASKAVDLASPTNSHLPNNATAYTKGRYAKTLEFINEFTGSGVAVDQVKMTSDCSPGGRIRVVVAWDSSPVCDANGGNCSGNPLDADLDLNVYAGSVSSTPICTSTTHDSSWEICDFEATCGTTYIARLNLWYQRSERTYLGMAWYSYPATGDRIALRAVANNNYVSAANAGTSALIADQAGIGISETFNLISNPDGSVSLWSLVNNRYVTAENAGAAPLLADAQVIGPWEKFTKISNSDGTVSFRSLANNQIVCADNSGASALIANRTAVGAWESFTVVPR